MLPWIGGPSVSSSGCTRKAHTASTITAATSEKIPMQMIVANQKTNVIRSISSDADSGSHRMRTATRVAITAATAAITTILIRAPRWITARETTSDLSPRETR